MANKISDKKILRRIILHRPIDEVLFELRQQGWSLIADNGDRAFLYKDKVVSARALKAANN
jgi:hypothetical protein